MRSTFAAAAAITVLAAALLEHQPGAAVDGDEQPDAHLHPEPGRRARSA